MAGGTVLTRVNDVSKRVMHSSGPGQERNENGEFRILENQTLSGAEMSERHISETRFPAEVQFAVLVLILVPVAGELCFETLTRIDCLREKLHRGGGGGGGGGEKKKRSEEIDWKLQRVNKKKRTQIICTATGIRTVCC